MRAILTCCVALVVCAAVSAEDTKIDASKLIGKWEPKDQKDGQKVVIEFLTGGKAKFTHTADGKDTKSEGTYKVDGNKITVTMSVDGEEKTHTHNISKLTDTEMVGADEKGQEHTFVRIKISDRTARRLNPKYPSPLRGSPYALGGWAVGVR